MPDWTTAAERAAMRARCEAATRAKWTAVVTLNNTVVVDDGDDDAPLATMHQGYEEACANAAFIAAAREDVPRLLAENAALAGLLERAGAWLNPCDAQRRGEFCKHAECMIGMHIEAALAARGADAEAGTTEEGT